MYNLFGESETVKIAKSITSNNVIEKFFFTIFLSIFKTESNLSLAHDRECFFSNFHSARLSKSLQEGHKQLFSSFKFTESAIRNFIQVLMLELVNQVLSEQTKSYQQHAEKAQATLSDSDQSLLFYISACEKRYNNCKSQNKATKLQCIERLKLSSDISTFISKFQTWTKKRDRGGLSLPCDNFFLMLREFETIVRCHASIHNLHATSLLKDKLKELIMESLMVKFYSEKLFCGIEFENYINVLEDIIHIFLTVRGFAVTRVLRNAMAKEKTRNKTSASFRQALKEKSVN